MSVPGGQVLYKGGQVATRPICDFTKYCGNHRWRYVPVGVSNVRLDAIYRDHLRAISAAILRKHPARHGGGVFNGFGAGAGGVPAGGRFEPRTSGRGWKATGNAPPHWNHVTLLVLDSVAYIRRRGN